MAGLRPIRVVVGEDQPIFRDGIVHVLREEGFEVVDTAGEALELIRKIRSHRPDVAVTDIQMPPDMTDDGLRAVLAARRGQKGLGVLVLSQFLEDRYALDLVAEGSTGVGYLLKEKVGQIAMFTDAVGRVARGETVLDPEVVSTLVGRRAGLARSTISRAGSGRFSSLLLRADRTRVSRRTWRSPWARWSTTSPTSSTSSACKKDRATTGACSPF